MATFVWTSEAWEGARLVEAADLEAAYELCIQEREKTAESRAEAEAWFEQNDALLPVRSDLPTLR
jgi:Mg-chelatase subunit ChlI